MRDRPSSHWAKIAYCPCHHDEGTRPSLNVDYKPSKYDGEGFKLLVWCRTCRHEVTLEDVCAALGLQVADVQRGNEGLACYVKPKPSTPLPPACDVAAWHERLLGEPGLLAYLYENRGLDEETIRAHCIGYDRGRYTLPVLDGRLVNVRR